MAKKYSFILVFFIVCILLVTGFYEIKGNAYILFRNIPKEIVLFKIQDFKTVETEHFIIRHNSKDIKTLDLVERASEKYYDDICNDFNYYPNDKSTIIFYEDSSQLLKNANLRESKPPMGVYYASTIQILSPKLWNVKNDNIESLFMNEGPMIHEFTHLIIDDITKGNYPLWFTEGVALYQEYDKTGYEWGKDVDLEKIYTIDQLNNNFSKLNQYLAYTQSFRVVKYITDEYGFEVINELLIELRKGNNFNKAFQKITGDKLEVLNI